MSGGPSRGIAPGTIAALNEILMAWMSARSGSNKAMLPGHKKGCCEIESRGGF